MYIHDTWCTPKYQSASSCIKYKLSCCKQSHAASSKWNVQTASTVLCCSVVCQQLNLKPYTVQELSQCAMALQWIQYSHKRHMHAGSRETSQRHFEAERCKSLYKPNERRPCHSSVICSRNHCQLQIPWLRLQATQSSIFCPLSKPLLLILRCHE